MRAKALFVVAIIFLATLLVGQSVIGNDIRIALLEQAQHQQDMHMEYQDKLADQTRERINGIENELSQIRGFGLGISSILALAQLMQILIGLKGKQKI